MRITRKRSITLLFFTSFLFFSCAHNKNVVISKVANPERDELVMIAVGDNLIHQQLITAAKAGTQNVYDFSPYYREVEHLIRTADLAFINQESLIAGEEFGYSGYPEFNGPSDMAKTISGLGFDIVNHATNHAMDKGGDAILRVLKNWKEYPAITVLGIHESEEERNTKINIIEKNNIKIGLLSYTYGLNGIPLPKNKPWLVSLIDTDVMAKEIDALRPLCDVLIVSMHWGNEYEHTPSKRQEELAVFLAEHKVDLVIGHHPHVVQPVRVMDRPDGGSMLVYFSLGNFISAQKDSNTLLGGMMLVKIVKEKNGNIFMENAELLPLITHYERGYNVFRVYLLSDYTDELSSVHAAANSKNEVNLNYFNSVISKVFGRSFVAVNGNK